MLDDPHPLCPVISFVIALLAGSVDVVRTLPLSTILLVNSSIVMFSTTPGLSILVLFSCTRIKEEYRQ